MKTKLISIAVVAAAGLILLASGLHAQAPAEPATTDAAPATTVHKKTMFETLKQGGIVMFPIGILSVLTVYLIVDGVLRTAVKKVAPAEHEKAVQSLFRMGDYVGAYNYCKANPTPLTNVLRVGISLLGDGKQVAEEGMIGEIGKESAHMNTYISYLSVIGVCSPMIGLLGTVTGMIKAFDKLGASGIGDPSGLSAAIGEVLVATASGLFIAIPAFMAFYFLRNRSMDAIHHIQDIINGLFRKMPYESLADVNIGDEEVFAAEPNWNAGAAEAAAE